VVGVIAVCLFPLWPSTVRQGVYYLSLAAAGFLIFILALTVIRMIVFGIVWALTFGKHHLWLLPNLTEDVGFLASFWPLYKYEYKPGDSSNDNKKSSKRKSSDTDAPLISGEEAEEKTSPDTAPVQPEQSETESEGSSQSFEKLEKEEATDPQQ